MTFGAAGLALLQGLDPHSDGHVSVEDGELTLWMCGSDYPVQSL